MKLDRKKVLENGWEPGRTSILAISVCRCLNQLAGKGEQDYGYCYSHVVLGLACDLGRLMS